jgi:glutathione synthase
MDPIETMIVDRDTSLAFMVEAQRRGHEIWWYHPSRLWWEEGRLLAHTHLVQVGYDQDPHYRTIETADRELTDFDVVLVRQDPPFDMGYVANTYLLELVAEKVMVINDPKGVRDFPEKLSTLHFADLLPATLVGREMRAIRAFAEKYGEVVLKPSFLAGGEGVFKLKADAADFEARIEKLLAETKPEPIVVQQFLPKISEGDRRVFVLDGAHIGTVGRMPSAGEFRVNLHAGGLPARVAADARDLEVVQRLAPMLKRANILFAGLDLIDGKLIEINVTSPTLVRQLLELTGIDAPSLFWDAVERKLAIA